MKLKWEYNYATEETDALYRDESGHEHWFGSVSWSGPVDWKADLFTAKTDDGYKTIYKGPSREEAVRCIERAFGSKYPPTPTFTEATNPELCKLLDEARGGKKNK
jgi:hypothetical protein